MNEWINVKDEPPTAETAGGEDGMTEATCWDGKVRKGHWWVIADNPEQFSTWRAV